MTALPWIKISTDLHRKRQTAAIMVALRLHDLDQAVGVLTRFWALAEAESDSSGVIPMTPAVLDAAMSKKGFASAMISAGWLAEHDGGLKVPDFDKHMGATARRRTEEAEKKAKQRGDKRGTVSPSEGGQKGDNVPSENGTLSPLEGGQNRDIPSREDLDLEPDSEVRESNPSVSTDDGLKSSHAKATAASGTPTGTISPQQGGHGGGQKGDTVPPASGTNPGQTAADFDPMKADADRCRRFLSAWNAAGFRHLERLTPSLAGRLHSAARDDPEFDRSFEAAIARAGRIPFFHGEGRSSGSLDPMDVLKDPDWVRQVLAGRFDPRPKTKPPPASKPTSEDLVAAEVARMRGEQ